MAKIDAFQRFEDTEMKRLQVVYLNDCGFSAEQIHQWVDYAVSTIKGYIRKFGNLLEKAKGIFKNVSQKLKQEVVGRKECVYLFKFFDEMDKIIWSKVGTTTRLPEKRLAEEVRYYEQRGITIGRTEICSVIDCGEMPAEGAESEARAKFIRLFPKAYCKNDRFYGVNISTKKFNEIITAYLAPITA